jgi:methylmalonyl-CoA/ethylmalonyl-CoA epimerase
LGVDNHRDTLGYLNSIGIRDIQSGHQLGDEGKNKYTYLDTSDKLGFICEIVDISPDFIKPKPDYWYPNERDANFKPIFIMVAHIGIVVRSISEKIRQYSHLFGLSCLRIEELSSVNIKDMHVYGEKRDYSAKVALCNLGNIKIKLIEPLNASIYSDFYDRYGEGVIHHICMEVADFKQALRFFKLKGIEVIQSGTYMGRSNYAYLSTSDDINFITEIIDKKSIEKKNISP